MKIKFTEKKKPINLFNFLEKNKNINIKKVSESNLNEIVEKLKNETPTDTGLLRSSWYGVLEVNNQKTTLTIHNTDLTNGGTPLVYLINYGHGTGTGGYIPGKYFMEPILKNTKIKNDIKGVINNGK